MPFPATGSRRSCQCGCTKGKSWGGQHCGCYRLQLQVVFFSITRWDKQRNVKVSGKLGRTDGYREMWSVKCWGSIPIWKYYIWISECPGQIPEQPDLNKLTSNRLLNQVVHVAVDSLYFLMPQSTTCDKIAIVCIWLPLSCALSQCFCSESDRWESGGCATSPVRCSARAYSAQCL